MSVLELIVLLCGISIVHGSGFLLLYRPKDFTDECSFSRHLRYDISFGMGMSDTMSMVFRTLNDIDYECVVEIVTSSNEHLIVVVRYPNAISKNCAMNRDAFTILKRWRCTRLCDLVEGVVYSPYFIFVVRNRLRFLFRSNSSINADINASLYQVTITSARLAPSRGCNKRNETVCVVDQNSYCFTTGVVCDGIKNCGVDDWFDEKLSQCTFPEQRLGYAPIIAVVAAMLCAFIAGGHLLLRLLPPHANSFFIFNENEDNRLCIDPVLVPHGVAPDINTFRHPSIIPVCASVSTDDGKGGTTPESSVSTEREEKLCDLEEDEKSEVEAIEKLPNKEEKPTTSRKSTMRSVTEKLQKLMKATYSVTGTSSRKNKDSFI